MKRALAAGFAVVVLSVLIYAVFFRRASDDSLSPVTLPAVDSKPAPSESLPARVDVEPLAVEGLVLALDTRAPLEGIELLLGEEKATTAKDGGFFFNARSRRGLGTLVVLRGGAPDVEWSGMYVGGLLPGEGEGAPELDSTMRWTLPTTRPTRVFWTVNIGSAAGGLSGGSLQRDGKPGGFDVARVQAALFEKWDRTGVVRLLGRSPLPDGAHLDAVLYFDGERMVSSTERAELKDGRFSCWIRFPDELTLHTTLYDLRLIFGVGLEDPDAVEAWKVARPALPWKDAEDFQSHVGVYAGDPREERGVNATLQTQFREALGLASALQRTLMARAQEFKILGFGWDPELLRLRAATAEAWFGDPVVGADGRIDLALWRRFIDDEWRPEARKLKATHESRRRGKYASAEQLMSEVIDRLLVLSKIESVILYQGLGQSPDPKDLFADEELPEGDRVILLQILKKDFAILERMKNLPVP